MSPPADEHDLLHVMCIPFAIPLAGRRRTDASVVERQGRTAVRAHQGERKEDRTLDKTREGDRRGDGEQAALGEEEIGVFEEDAGIEEVFEKALTGVEFLHATVELEPVSDFTYATNEPISSGLKKTALTTVRSMVVRMLPRAPVMMTTRGRWYVGRSRKASTT